MTRRWQTIRNVNPSSMTRAEWDALETADPNRRPDTQPPIGASTAGKRRLDAENSAAATTVNRDRPKGET